MGLVLLALIAVGCGGSDRPGGNVVNQGPVTLQDVQNSIFSPSCATIGCHQGGSPPMGLDLSSGEALANILGVPSAERPEFDRIEPFNATDSYLYMKVSGDPRILGDPMPAQGSALSSQRLQLLEDWIDEGAHP